MEKNHYCLRKEEQKLGQEMANKSTFKQIKKPKLNEEVVGSENTLLTLPFNSQKFQRFL